MLALRLSIMSTKINFLYLQRRKLKLTKVLSISIHQIKILEVLQSFRNPDFTTATCEEESRREKCRKRRKLDKQHE